MSNGNIQNYLNAEELHLHKLFSEVRGFYIPEYQRPYTWKKEDIERLFESITTSLRQMSKADYPTFLGAILAITPDMELQNAYNINQSEGPGIVHILIDGQQRITSLLLIISELYKDFMTIKSTLDEKKLKKDFAPLQGLLNSSISRSRMALFTKNDFIEEGVVSDLAYLPKIIYGITNDKWKKTEIGNYNHIISQYLYSLSKDTNAQIKEEENLNDITERVKDCISFYQSEFSSELINELKINQYFQERSLSRKISKEIINLIEHNDPEIKNVTIEFLGKHILLEFILTKVIFAHIRVDKESFAFDIFDSLNSTGDSLTAFETFKPSVVKFFNENSSFGKYEDSEEKRYLDRFTNYLSKKKREDRHNITKQFITSLIYYYSGDIVIEATNEQRKKLKELYESFEDRKDKLKFIESFEILSDFQENIWEADPLKLHGSISDEAKIALAIFSKVKHTITIPILAHYYKELIYNKSKPDFKTFSDIVKGLFAFSVIWRLLNAGGTAGIDDKSRTVIKKISYLENSKLLSKENLFEELKNQLDTYFKDKKKKLDREAFVNEVSDVQYSSSSRNIWIKFFLLASNHESTADKVNKGLIKNQNIANVNNLLTIENWLEFLNPLTIEHIIPQNPENANDWNNELFLPSYLHNIGNLIPMPKIQNGVLSNRNWEQKRKILEIITTPDMDERKDLLNNPPDDINLELSKKAKDILIKSNYYKSLESLTYIDHWSPEFVKKRARNIADEGWRTISPWLGY
jgi:hypothetical protein